MYHLSVPDPNSRNAAIKSRKLNDAILMLKKHWAAAASFSHPSTGFGGVRWHIKSKKK
jgi:hypothetical protein